MNNGDFSFINGTLLETFCRDILQAAGLNATCSRSTAEGLVLASLRGVDSHGVQLLPHYIRSIREGRLNPDPRWNFIQTSSSTGVLNADHALGFSAGSQAMRYCMEMAEEHGMGAVSVHNSSHGGMLAYYTLPAAQRGYFALCVTNTTPRMVALGGKSPFLGTNPLCYAVPLLNEEPLCYDSATTQITGNKINMHRRLGQPLPPGVAADAAGNETTDPEHAVNLFAFGGYKGFGIALLVDILCGVLAGMPNSERVSKMFGNNYDEKRNLGQFFFVFNIAVFRQVDVFVSELQEEIDRLRNGNNNVLAPGDKEKTCYRERIKTGIPLDKPLMDQFYELAETLNITPLSIR